MVNHPASAVLDIQQYYRDRASTNKYATSPDFNLREVENEYLSRQLRDGVKVLDVGCGNGYSTLSHAARWDAQFTGVDFVSEMVDAAKDLAAQFKLRGQVDFRTGDVTDLDFPDESFDFVITQRCLLNLTSREDQWKGMREIARVLKPGGVYLMMEGTLQGLRALNELRVQFDLDPIPEAENTYNWFSNKFDEPEMLEVARSLFREHMGIQRFGMYYFISRIVHPLLVSPEAPKFDAPINAVAQMLCRKIPDYDQIGHVALFMFRR